jgi:hypothetical protein
MFIAEVTDFSDRTELANDPRHENHALATTHVLHVQTMHMKTYSPESANEAQAGLVHNET